jgi:thiamine-phosphate diphosphorylase
MLICVTARRLCREDFLTRVERLAAAGVDAIMLREKDLIEPEYTRLAEQVKRVCEPYPVRLIVNTHVRTARELGIASVHLPMGALPQNRGELADFAMVSTSVHSPQEAVQAEKWGVDSINAGHIFPTDCKRGLPPRGLEFLRQVCGAVQVPVYAIGGIQEDRVQQVLQAGASGVCVMSQWMECEQVEKIIQNYRRILCNVAE